MQYFVMFPKFEIDEGQYKRSSKKHHMMNITGELRLFHNKPMMEVQTVYKERGFSDFLKAGSFVAASKKVQQLFFEHGFQGAQFIPLLVSNNRIHEGYSFMHKIATYDILDPIASKADMFDEEDNDYAFILHLYVDEKKINSLNIQHDIFMCSNYASEFICNERVKIAFEAVNITGIEFNPVEFSS